MTRSKFKCHPEGIFLVLSGIVVENVFCVHLHLSAKSAGKGFPQIAQMGAEKDRAAGGFPSGWFPRPLEVFGHVEEDSC
jgi:hypothetical protein